MNNASFKDNKLKTRKVVHAQRRFDIEKESIKHYHQEKKKILKETKNLLTVSFISILFSLLALTGTTYAWFTSTISNSSNRIQAGSLDVGLLAEDVNHQIIDLSSDEVAVFNVESLLPGNPVQTILTVKNKGTVDLKFALFFNIKEDYSPDGTEDAKLSKMLKVYVREYNKDDNNVPTEEDNIGTMAGVSGTSGFISEDNLSAGENKQYRVWIGLDSKASVDTYNGHQIKFDIRLSAKQKEDTSSMSE